MTADQIQDSIAGDRQRNLQLRQVLSDKKVNLSEQRPTDVHFWAWSQQDAAVLARELYKKGFLVTLLSPAPTQDKEASMGRQVNFYMHPKNEAEFVQHRCNDCKSLLTDHPTPEPEWLHKLPDSWIKGCQVLIGKPGPGGPLRARLIEEQGYFLVDAFNYELVEFTRCGLSGGELSRGRLWFDPLSTFEGIPKSAEFVRWATSLLGWIRHHYSREEAVYGNYVGVHAKEWADQGGRLVGYPIHTRDPS